MRKIKYGKPCPSCDKTCGYQSKLCWACTWAAKPKKHCLDCGAITRPSQERCWECHKKRVQVPEKQCADCGGPIRKYDKKTVRCQECKILRVVENKKQWLCIDCSVAVERRTKRCRSCHIKACHTRPRKKKTPEQRAKQSLRLKGKPNPKLRGRKRAASTRKKMREHWTEARREAASQRWKGKSNPGYMHGNGSKGYPKEFSIRLRAFIRRRDQNTCQMCQKKFPYRSRSIGIHHIDYDKTNNQRINLIVLCKSCHGRTNFRRSHWKSLLQALQVQRERNEFPPASDLL